MNFAEKERESFYSRLIWLFPAIFFFHVIEESLGFARWVQEILEGQIDISAFYINNAGFMVVLLGLTALASRKKTMWATVPLFFWVSGQQFWNFIFHMYTQFHFRHYSPGYFTALFLYFPVFLYLSYIALRERFLSGGFLFAAIVAGAFGMWFTIWAGLYHFGSFPWARWV
ncbi:MAG TPA: HXXEE domain-containing protein [Leptospiraceae bacterium]|nr:HXXEE domain-containing protein [Leptospiraceae bacterium]